MAFIELTDTHREVQHAVLQHKVIGPLDVLPFLQTGVVDAGVGEAARQVGTGQRLHWVLGDGDGVTELLHVLREEVGVSNVEGCHRGVERRHSDGGDLGSNCRWQKKHHTIFSNLTLFTKYHVRITSLASSFVVC